MLPRGYCDSRTNAVGVLKAIVKAMSVLYY